jgi:hypothetical protein
LDLTGGNARIPADLAFAVLVERERVLSKNPKCVVREVIY